MLSSEEQTPLKSSMEILSELFSTFNAEPPVIVKKEKDESKKHKKSKKKHKHKEKKHKKKAKKRKHSSSSSSSNSDLDLAEILIKTERQSPEKKLKLEIDEDVKFENETDDQLYVKSTECPSEAIPVKSDMDAEDSKIIKKERHKKKHKHKYVSHLCLYLI